MPEKRDSIRWRDGAQQVGVPCLLSGLDGEVNQPPNRIHLARETLRLPSGNLITLIDLTPAARLTWACRYVRVIERTHATRVGATFQLRDDWLSRWGQPA